LRIRLPKSGPGSPQKEPFLGTTGGGLNGGIFYSLEKAQFVIERWRVEYNAQGQRLAVVSLSPISQSMAVGDGTSIF
jgi:hypothetical protein